MKRLKVVLVAVFVMSFVFSSCTKEEGTVDFKFVHGKWLFDKSTATSSGITIPYPTVLFKNEDGCSKDYIEILAGGNVKNGDYQSACVLSEKVGTWVQTENTLVIDVPASNLKETFTVTNLTANEMVLKIDGSVNGQSGTFSLYFTK